MTGSLASNNQSASAASRPASELTADLARQVAELVHAEIQLAKVEVAGKRRHMGLGAGELGVAALFGVAGFGCLLAAAVTALNLKLSLWLAALLVGLACLAIAGLAAVVARSQVKRAAPPVPSEAIESTKEDMRWLKMQARSASK